MTEAPLGNEIQQRLHAVEDECAQLRKHLLATRAALRQSEKSLALAINANEAGYYEHAVGAPDWCYFSERWAHIFGYAVEELPPKEELLSWSWWRERLHPDHRDRVGKAYDDFISGRTEHFKDEFLIRHRSGEWRWLKAKAIAVARDATGRATAVAGTHEDITDRKTAISALRESEEKYRDLVDHANDLVQSVGVDGSFLYVNRAWCETLGYSREEAAHLSIDDVVHPRDLAKKQNFFKCIFAGQQISGIELTFLTRDGDEILVEGNVNCKIDGDKPIFSRGIFRDITKRKRAVEALQKAHKALENRVKKRTAELDAANVKLRQEVEERKRAEETLRSFAASLEQSNRDLQDFAYIVSHDLQEPLMLIRSFCERLCARYDDLLSVEARQYLERIDNASLRMQNLIEGLLLYSRVTTKAQPFITVDLTQVATEVLADLEMRLEQTGGRVTVEKLGIIEADAMQMHQLLQNLIGNALKFHRPGEVPLVRIFSPPGDDLDQFITICVEDNGIGFDEKFTEQIFGMFQRLHSHGEYDGAGIGLSICKKIVERHGGSIAARSTPGQGARFCIRLPIKQNL